MARRKATPAASAGGRFYGRVKDVRDPRDFMFAAARRTTPLPPAVDTAAGFPDPYDQGQLGSCTGNATAGTVQYERRRQGLADFTPSRLMIYFNGRASEGTVNEDSGCQIRDVVKAYAKLGACPEDSWPYDIARFAETPPAECYAEGLTDRAISYHRVPPDEHALKAALAEGFPVVFGFEVPESFESEAVAKSGIMPMPKRGEAMVGGHAVVLVGYDDKAGMGKVRNSWGTGWGQGGYFQMPYAYLFSRKCSDFWVIKTISAA